MSFCCSIQVFAKESLKLEYHCGNTGQKYIVATLVNSYSKPNYLWSPNGDTSQTIIINEEDFGKSFSVEYFCSCWQSSHPLEFMHYPKIEFVANFPEIEKSYLLETVNSACSDANNGRITFKTDHNLNFLWEDGYIGSERHDLKPGTYNIMIKDEFGCSEAKSIIINEPKKINDQITIETKDVTCSEHKDGRVHISFDNKRLKVLWSDENSDLNNTRLYSGEYNFKIVDDSNRCSNYSFTVGQLPKIEMNISPVLQYSGYAISCNNSDNGVINYSIIGGKGPYSIHKLDDSVNVYSTLASSEKTRLYTNKIYTEGVGSLKKMKGGEHVFIISDSNGCSITKKYEIEAPDKLNIEGISIVPCESRVSVDVKGGTGEYNYKWINGSNLIGSTKEITNLSVKSRKYSVIIQDGNSCQIDTSISIVRQIIHHKQLIHWLFSVSIIRTKYPSNVKDNYSKTKFYFTFRTKNIRLELKENTPCMYYQDLTINTTQFPTFKRERKLIRDCVSCIYKFLKGKFLRCPNLQR